jgi:hypothetical protein
MATVKVVVSPADDPDDPGEPDEPDDNDPPTIILILPEDEATDVARSGEITITFSEAMAEAGTVALETGGDSTQLTGDWYSKSAYIAQYSDLDPDTVYKVQLIGFTDAAGNPLSGSLDYSFTTKSDVAQKVIEAQKITDKAVAIPVAGEPIPTVSEEDVFAADEYFGAVTWFDADNPAYPLGGGTFDAETQYAIIVKLAAKPGYTFTGTVESEWTVDGATYITSNFIEGEFILHFEFPDPDDGTPVTTAADLKTALESTTPSTITLGGNITLDATTVTMGASHTLNTNGKTLTISGSGQIATGGNALTVNGGGMVTIARTRVHGIGGNGTLNLANITVNLQNTETGGISVQTVHVDSGATVSLDSATGSSMIEMNSGYALNVSSGGKIDIKNFTGSGIRNNGGTVHVCGGEISVGAGQSNN